VKISSRLSLESLKSIFFCGNLYIAFILSSVKTVSFVFADVLELGFFINIDLKDIFHYVLSCLASIELIKEIGHFFGLLC
jgi:hypothetical protein